MRKIKGQKGLSLVEVTIMLLVLMLLTSVLAPSMWDFIHDAQWVKVKEDCEAIGISISRLTRDIGPCLRAASATACNKAGRVDILTSTGLAAIAFPASATIPNMDSTGWNAPGANSNADGMEDQLVINAPGYATPFTNYPTTIPVGPLFGTGWRGAYLTAPIGPDPWGTAYYVNSGFLATATDASDTTSDGDVTHWWEADVFCLTAGPNKKIETPFKSATATNGTDRAGDDFLYVISGSGK